MGMRNSGNSIIPIVLMLFFAAFLQGCGQSTPSTPNAQKVIQDKITAESRGAIKLVSFTKTDGQSAEVNKVPIYTFEYEGELEFVRDCKWLTEGIFDRTHHGFQTETPPPRPANGQFSWDQWMSDTQEPGTPMREGAHQKIKGKIFFEQTENGWRSTQFEVTPVGNATVAAVTKNTVTPPSDAATWVKEVPVAPPQLAFYTTDAGATFFAEDQQHEAPFKYQGADAVRAWIYTCGTSNVKHLGYLERCTPEFLQALANAKATGKTLDPLVIVEQGDAIYEVCKPPSTQWVGKATPAGQRMIRPDCPSNDAIWVLPPPATKAGDKINVQFGVAAIENATNNVAQASTAPKTGQGQSPLHKQLMRAVMADDLAKVRQLVSQGADPEAFDQDADSAVTTALGFRKLDIAKFFIVRGIDINRERPGSFRGVTPWFDALSTDDVATIQLMLDHGADPNATFNGGRSPLHVVSTEGAAAILIEKGANIEATNMEGATPLGGAPFKTLGYLRYLVQHRAHVNSKNAKGETPLHIVAEYGNTGTPKPTYPNCTEVAAILIGAGADINARDHLGDTPLAAAKRKDAEKHDRSAIISFLISKGANE